MSTPTEAWLAEIDGRPSVCWREPEAWGERRDDEGALEAFARLDRDEAFLDFTLRYGPLVLCEHQLPAMHPSFHGAVPRGGEDRCAFLRTGAESSTPIQYCPLEVWRRYVLEVRAALKIAADLHRGRPGDRDDWEQLLGGPSSIVREAILKLDAVPERYYTDGFTPGAEGLAVDRAWRQEIFAVLLDGWLELGRVRPLFQWSTVREPARHPTVRLGGGSVYGAVAREVVFIVARVDGLAICSGCGAAFVPKRRPAAGRKTWCPECSESGAAARDRQRRRRERLPQEPKRSGVERRA